VYCIKPKPLLSHSHSMRFMAGLLVSSSYLASVAAAQEIPEFDTRAFCEHRAGPDTQDNRRFETCLMVEDYALAELANFWSRTNETMRLECIEEASSAQRYAVLASCIMARIREQRRGH
jgi:hypothetical protein